MERFESVVRHARLHSRFSAHLEGLNGLNVWNDWNGFPPTVNSEFSSWQIAEKPGLQAAQKISEARRAQTVIVRAAVSRETK